MREGFVLDIGCCTGRHLEMLAERGIQGLGIDISPLALKLALGAGVNCEMADINTYVSPRAVDTILTLGGNGGIIGTIDKLPAFLQRLASWLTPDGSIIFTSTDWCRIDPGLLDSATARTERRYPGDWQIRFHLGDRIGPWFPWAVFDRKSLEKACETAGLRIFKYKSWSGGVYYAALLRKVDPS
ncbi:class I SAM-dependent methyltransferase [Streptomyces sp. NPDC051664]|uniref:class I SAM-dependent methyltransferase n=1 Tax=Streptomyces sp. NPDC051664 TaxID=3365668 RepID=UPI00379A354E